MRLTPLCKIANKYGTDKCPQVGHHYTEIYYELFKYKRKKVKKVLELGIGSREVMQWVPEHYQTGASLLMWRDFFPNAQIYGADIHPSTIFQSDRITTFMINTKKEIHLKKLISQTGADLDLVIDDGPHDKRSQVRTAQILLPLLKKDCLYIIEDSKSVDFIEEYLKEYDCEAIRFPGSVRSDALIIIRNNHV